MKRGNKSVGRDKKEGRKIKVGGKPEHNAQYKWMQLLKNKFNQLKGFLAFARLLSWFVSWKGKKVKSFPSCCSGESSTNLKYAWERSVFCVEPFYWEFALVCSYLNSIFIYLPLILIDHVRSGIPNLWITMVFKCQMTL